MSFWCVVTRHVQGNENKKFAYLCYISRKMWKLKLIFCLQIHEGFLQVDGYHFLWVCVAQSNQNPKNDKLIISLQYLKEKRVV